MASTIFLSNTDLARFSISLEGQGQNVYQACWLVDHAVLFLVGHANQAGALDTNNR